MRQLLEVRIESNAFDAGTVLIAELSGRETISRIFELDLRVVTQGEPLDEDKVLTSSTTIVFERRAADSGTVLETRRISGIVRELCDRSLRDSQHREYFLKLVPRAWQAELTSTSDVMMDLSIPDIIKKKLADGAGLDPGKDLELRLKGRYEPREFVVQYKESNLAFASRLAEDLGISFFFEEAPDGREVMVFADDNSAFKPSAPDTSPYTSRGERADIYELEARRQLVPKAFAARDYNYRNPSMDLLGEAQAGTLGMGKIDEYGPHAKTPAEANFYAQVRAEEAIARSLVFEGKSDVPGIRAGSILKVEGHPRGDLELVVTEVLHHVAQNVAGFGDAVDSPYENTFRAIPKKHTFRPVRLTPKPVAHGVVTGLVEAASPTQMGAIDDQGRYRVVFMYDSVTGRGDGKASRPLRMAQPSAGDSRGFHLPLKPGTEVLVTCLNGDPDRPIISGAVPNPQTPSPVTSKNSEKSVWTTNKSQIAIDDDQARCKMSVDGEDHVIQVGQPEMPEVGILLGTTESNTDMTEKTKTSASKEDNKYCKEMTAIASGNVLVAAGVPQPMNLWQKFEKAAKEAAEFANNVAGYVDKVHDKYEEYKHHAKAHQAEAEKLVEDTRQILMLELRVKESAVPQVVVNPDKSVRYESKEEAEQRTFVEGLRAHPEFAEELNHAMEDAKEAKEEAESHELGLKEKLEGVEEKAKKVGEKIESYAEQALKLREQAEKVKKISEAIDKIPAAKKLFSVLSKIFGEAAMEALDVTAAASQKLAHAVPKAARERDAATVGSFSKPFNLQFSRNSASIYGAKNGFVFGGVTATMFSPINANVIGGKRVDVKAKSTVEVAAKHVMASSIDLMDVYSKKNLKLVAHPHDKAVDMPGGHTMFLHSKEGIMMDSVDKDIEAKAKKNIKLTAQEENIEATAKHGIKAKTLEKDIELTAEKGKIEIMANKGQASLRAKKKALVQSLDEDFTIVADKGKGTVKAAKELQLECKSASWKASGNIELKVKKLVVNGSKVELG